MKARHNTTTTTTTNRDVYTMVTEKMISSLEQGIIPWHKPWRTTRRGNVDSACLARNYVSNKPYSLLNQMLLGWNSDYYITFKQVTELGGHIRKGEKASAVVFFKKFTKEEPVVDEQGKPVLDEDGNQKIELRDSWTLRYYNVFSLAQTEGCKDISNRPTLADPATTAEDDDNGLSADAVAEDIISRYVEREKTLTFTTKMSDRAYYSPASDSVCMPHIKQFDDLAEYYSTAFHELTHSTLKASRCNRIEENLHAPHGSAKYAKEELVAEMGACFLTNLCGLDTSKAFPNSTAYIQSWLQALRNDKKLVVFASAQAEKATNYILGRTA